MEWWGATCSSTWTLVNIAMPALGAALGAICCSFTPWIFGADKRFTQQCPVENLTCSTKQMSRGFCQQILVPTRGVSHYSVQRDPQIAWKGQEWEGSKWPFSITSGIVSTCPVRKKRSPRYPMSSPQLRWILSPHIQQLWWQRRWVICIRWFFSKLHSQSDLVKELLHQRTKRPNLPPKLLSERFSRSPAL